MAKLIIIAAIGLNNELGMNNKLIWSLKEDLQFFKEKTINHKIVMGYNTFKSLPKLLPKREYIVLTHHKIDVPNGQVFNNFSNLLEYLNTLDEDIYIIGGSTIYKLFLPYVDELLLTKIKAESKDADTYFPIYNNNDYIETILKEVMEENISYEHVLMRRKNEK